VVFYSIPSALRRGISVLQEVFKTITLFSYLRIVGVISIEFSVEVFTEKNKLNFIQKKKFKFKTNKFNFSFNQFRIHAMAAILPIWVFILETCLKIRIINLSTNFQTSKELSNHFIKASLSSLKYHSFLLGQTKVFENIAVYLNTGSKFVK